MDTQDKKLFDVLFWNFVVLQTHVYAKWNI